jgi:iron(III) transport system ATP-binding protein
VISVRPQGLHLHRDAPPAGNGKVAIPVAVTSRVYLGESWDYVVAPADSATRLRVAAPPLDVHEVGDKVWLEFDPRQIAVVG